jgi:CBS domain-containing protein
MTVREIMMAPVVTVQEDCTLEEAAKLMLERNIGCLPVLNRSGEICGIVTESDFVTQEKGIPFSFYRFPQVFGQWMPKEGVEKVYAAARTMTAAEIMSRRVVSVREDDTLESLLEKMLHSGYHRLPVLRGKTPVGIVARHDLLNLMCSRLPACRENT